MALTFPSSPALNDTYTASGKTWQYNGKGWLVVPTTDSILEREGATNLFYTHARAVAAIGADVASVMEGRGEFDHGVAAGLLDCYLRMDTLETNAVSLVEGKVPASQLPSYVDDVLEVANHDLLPTTGESGKLYIALDTGKVFRWSGSIYVEIISSPVSTDAVPEGTTNLYYTDERAAAAVATDLNNAIGIANSAYSNAEAAQGAANNAQNTADTAQGTADNALSTANAAGDAANTAQIAANNAQSAADSAWGLAGGAESLAKSAIKSGNSEGVMATELGVNLVTASSPAAAKTLLDIVEGGEATTYSDTAPANPSAGDRWVDTSTFDEYSYYGSAWVQLGAA
jgi:hypothetical protein